METEEFLPGDVVISKRSGRVWIVMKADADQKKLYPASVPVRAESWPTTSSVWMRKMNLELVQRRP